MKAPVLVAVDGPAEAYVALIEAATAAGVRIGWLVFDAVVDLPLPLASPALASVSRAVAVGAGRSIAVKPMRGQAVLRDLLREHFLGADVVLVAGSLEPGSLIRPGQFADALARKRARPCDKRPQGFCSVSTDSKCLR